MSRQTIDNKDRINGALESKYKIKYEWGRHEGIIVAIIHTSGAISVCSIFGSIHLVYSLKISVAYD